MLTDLVDEGLDEAFNDDVLHSSARIFSGGDWVTVTFCSSVLVSHCCLTG
ncbi:hypothetical protein HanRHA438_Chr04g0198191 [Helianthus annuus]|nr:hypothetical protein HanRHA438_Chr04g0198191 [Helianthus annuus]